MANKQVFGKTPRGQRVPEADTRNQAGGLAYSFGPEHALAQLACTGTFNDTFYGKAVDQLEGIRKAADQCSPGYIARCALYARQKGYMKDMPVALLVMLTKADPKLADKIFDRIVDNGKQVRNFVQFIRSGAFGRKSLGSGPKRLIQRWFASHSDYSVFRASVGNDPSIADVIKLSRPKPDAVLGFPQHEKDTRSPGERTFSRRALYGYLLGRDYEAAALPEIVQEYEAWKKGEGTGEVPNVDFRMLTSLPLTREDWCAIAKRGRWHQTRMNLNTYTRHGVFEVVGMEALIAAKLKDEDQIRKARVFPYQLLAAYINTGPESERPGYGGWGWRQEQAHAKPQVKVPDRLRLALQDALEISVSNVPIYDGRVAVIVDTSGSMQSAVTGVRKGSTSKVTCVDVAALVGATVMRKNPLAVVIPVDVRVHDTSFINPRDSIMTNANRLRKLGGGGTDLGAAMQFIETASAAPDLIIVVSDSESWIDSTGRHRWQGTQTMESFRRLQSRNPAIKMVNIDIQATQTSQTAPDPNIMNIGGFSDSIWDNIARFISNEGPQQWVDQIKALSLDPQPAGAVA